LVHAVRATQYSWVSPSNLDTQQLIVTGGAANATCDTRRAAGSRQQAAHRHADTPPRHHATSLIQIPNINIQLKHIHHTITGFHLGSERNRFCMGFCPTKQALTHKQALSHKASERRDMPGPVLGGRSAATVSGGEAADGSVDRLVVKAVRAHRAPIWACTS
jgi:hypothetical protein